MDRLSPSNPQNDFGEYLRRLCIRPYTAVRMEHGKWFNQAVVSRSKFSGRIAADIS